MEYRKGNICISLDGSIFFLRFDVVLVAESSTRLSPACERDVAEKGRVHGIVGRKSVARMLLSEGILRRGRVSHFPPSQRPMRADVHHWIIPHDLLIEQNLSNSSFSAFVSSYAYKHCERETKRT